MELSMFLRAGFVFIKICHLVGILFLMCGNSFAQGPQPPQPGFKDYFDPVVTRDVKIVSVSSIVHSKSNSIPGS